MTLNKRDYIDYANQIAIKEGLDPAIFIAQLNQESGFNPKAKNPKSGATGIGQFMPATAKGMGFTAGVDPLLDIRMAAKYMKGKLKMYNGDYRLALASYNAGSGNVAKYGGVPPFKETQNYVNSIMAMAGKGASDRGVLTGGVEKNGTITGAAVGFDVEKPTAPKFQGLNTTVADPTGQSNAKITPREEMALRNLAAPVQAPRDIRPDVVVGTNEDGTPQTVTASQYNEMLNQLDTERMLQANKELQANLPAMAKAEVQLGGQNAYDTLLGLRNEYNDMIANDPRMGLARLTPEQALDVMNVLKAKQGAGTLENVDKAQYYQMMNALENYQTPYDDLYKLTGEGYQKQIDNMKEFQKTALTLAQGNQQLAQELMKQAQAGNQDVINALQKTQQARIEQETNLLKQRQSDYGTMQNTQLQGLNTYYNNLPQTELDLLKAKNQFNQGVYSTQGGMYGTDVGANVEMAKPQIQADVDARNPVTREKLDIDRAKVDVARKNANTAEGVAASNFVINSGLNREGADKAAGAVPSIRNMMGNPNANMRQAIFGTALPYTTAQPTLADFTKMFNGD